MNRYSVGWYIERIKRVSKKYGLDPKVVDMTLHFQRHEYGKNAVEDGKIGPDEFGIDCYFENCHSLKVIIISGKISGDFIHINSEFDMEAYWHFYDLYHGKEQRMILRDGSIRKGEWPPLFISDVVIEEFKKYCQERKTIRALRSKTNFKSNDYPYSLMLDAASIKPGMVVVEEDDCDKDAPIYFMCKVVETYRTKRIEDGLENEYFVLHTIAYSDEGIEIYNWDSSFYLDSNFSKDDYNALGWRVYFKTIEEAKAFGINESQLEKASFDYCLKNNKYF